MNFSRCRWAACLLPLLATLASADPNRLSDDDAKAYAKPCAEYAAGLDDHPIATEVDADKPCAVRGEGGGAMVIPQKGLGEAALNKAGKDVVSLGQLWLRKWTLVVRGKALPAEKLRILRVKLDNKERPMPLLLLGVRKKGKGLELLLYARDSDPLLALPLAKSEHKPDLPLEVAWKRGEKKKPDTLTLTLAGGYQAVLPIDRLAD
jgi:hypothetical protein